MNISAQKVSFHLSEINDLKDNQEKENEKNNENSEELKLIRNSLSPQIEIKIRNSIKLLENDIKTLELTHVIFYIYIKMK